MKYNRTANKSYLAILLLLFSGLTFFLFYAENDAPPSLDISQIEQVYIYSRSGKGLAPLTADDTAILFKKMAGVKLIGEGTEEFKQYVGGQYKMFRFYFKDGSKMSFSASNPFYIIDSKWGFPSNYSDCDNLSNFYHSLVLQYFKPAEMPVPPSPSLPSPPF